MEPEVNMYVKKKKMSRVSTGITGFMINGGRPH